MKSALLAALLITNTLYTQQYTDGSAPVNGFTRHRISINDRTELYVGDGNSDTLFYAALKPKVHIKGVMVLFPPTGQLVDDAIAANSRLIAIAHDSGILTIVPSLNHNLCLDSVTLHFVNTVFSDVLKRYKVAGKRFVLGGFSLGGMNAVRYTELAYEDSTLVIVRPASVYGIDPPLDWARMYYSFRRAVEKNFSAAAVAEANYYLQRLDSEFGGRPEDHMPAYVRYSMYSRSSPRGGNARFLRSIPVRIYSDPDIDWQLANRRVDFYDMNVLDGAAMINQLHLDGNGQAELIIALGKGYRPDGTRHPHSWSLVVPEEHINWVLSCLR